MIGETTHTASEMALHARPSYVNYRLQSALHFVVSYIQPIKQHFESRTEPVQKAPLQSQHTERNGAVRPSYINYHPNEK